MTSEPKDVRLPVMVTRSEADAIDVWRYDNRVPTRAEAIRRLIGLGLKAAAQHKDVMSPTATSKMKNSQER